MCVREKRKRERMIQRERGGKESKEVGKEDERR